VVVVEARGAGDVGSGRGSTVAGFPVPLNGADGSVSLVEPLEAVGWPWWAVPRPEPVVTLPRSVADVLSRHVTFEIESIDRMYCNVYPPKLQYTGGAAAFSSAIAGSPTPRRR
jgi:hypothetical protein